MNRKFVFLIALIVALVSISAVSAGFLDFLGLGGSSSDVNVVEDGEYCTVDEVSAYIKEFHKLPSNYITKKEAQSLGWHGDRLKNMLLEKALVETLSPTGNTYCRTAIPNT